MTSCKLPIFVPEIGQANKNKVFHPPEVTSPAGSGAVVGIEIVSCAIIKVNHL